MQDSEAIQRMTIEWTRAQPSVGRFIRSFVRDRAQADRDREWATDDVLLMLTEVADRLQMLEQQGGRLGDPLRQPA